jgi:predicted RNA-binding Zn ribbon-like protein
MVDVNYDSNFLKENYYIEHKNFIFEPLFSFDSHPPINLPITYSLIEFLLNYDRRKLKRCPYCNNFFIAKSINRKTRCYSKDCEKAYQRDKKRKQREKEPDIYY